MRGLLSVLCRLASADDSLVDGDNAAALQQVCGDAMACGHVESQLAPGDVVKLVDDLGADNRRVVEDDLRLGDLGWIDTVGVDDDIGISEDHGRKARRETR